MGNTVVPTLADSLPPDLFEGAWRDIVKPYDALLQKSIAAIARSFQKRVATGMQSGRDFVLPAQSEQVRTADDFELVTWVVIRGEA